MAADVETELTLVIVADDPEAVGQRIASRASIGGFRLVPHPAQAIHDLYFDTSDELLKAKGLALRLRRVNGGVLIALKGDGEPLAGGGVRRLEIEQPWSEAALGRVVGELHARKVTLHGRAQGTAEPRDAVQALGLKVVQDREDRRTLRHVVEGGAAWRAVAELAIDAVTFHLPGLDVHHHEIEIEAIGPEGLKAARTIAGTLRNDYAVLRLGAQSKLAIGRAIERLHRGGFLRQLLGSGSALTPAAYDRIALELTA